MVLLRSEIDSIESLIRAACYRVVMADEKAANEAEKRAMSK